jgi:hypothetical protein
MANLPPRTHCTQPGGFCCGDGTCGNGDVCCPSGCAPADTTCCGSYYCTAVQTCCSNDGCADEGNTCCGSNQCTPDEQCCGDGNGCAPTTSTCCSDGTYCVEGSICCEDNDKDIFCSPGDTCIETLYLDLADYPGMDEIFENMCRGILRSGLSEATPNEIILTYIGVGQAAVAAQNRRDSGCAGTNRLQCAAVFSVPGEQWQCDEFPFATAVEGGSLAAVLCVPQHDNGAMGSRWGQMVKGKAKGTQIRVKINGFDCSTVTDDTERTVSGDETAGKAVVLRDAVLKNDTSGIYINGSVYGNYSGGNVALIIPFTIPDDFIGTFNLDYSIASGSLTSGSIMDDGGNDFGA